MAKTTITLEELTPDEMDELSLWFSWLGLSSEREITEHLERLGRIVQQMTSHHWSSATADNSLYSIAKAWILGKYRRPLPEMDMIETPLEYYRAAFGMGKAEADRYFQNVGIVVHELAMDRPLDAESFAGLILQVIQRLFMDVDPTAVEKTVEGFRKWQKEQERLPSMGLRREL